MRLWYKLNDDTRIQVKLGIGLSNVGEVGPVVGQGTIGAALISQAVLDDAVMEHLPPGGDLLPQYGSVPLAPLMYQDDLLNVAEGLQEARKVNEKVDILMKQRGLSLNQDKSVCLIWGDKKQKKEASEELKITPLMCGSFETKEVQIEKWLGQYLSSAGLADSVAQTVAARSGKIRAACFEIVQIVNDWRSQAVGGMESALLLWEACCISSLLHGAGTWMEVSSQTEEKLNSLQRWFVRLVLQVGPGTPKASLLWDFGLLDMGLRIWIEKLMLVLHLKRLDKDTLRSRVYEEQKAEQWPGLVRETEQICCDLNIESVHSTKLNMKAYRSIVTLACHRKNEERILSQSEGKVKCERITQGDYGKKDYVKSKQISFVRQVFKTRVGMNQFAGNYSHDRRFARTDWLCRCHKAREEESHLISGECDVYGEIRAEFDDLDDDIVLVDFFNRILKMKERLDEEDSGSM